MTALTAAKEVLEKGSKRIQLLVAASTVIYKGALVKINAAGYAAPCAAEAGAVFVGTAMETVDNSSGAAGDLTIDVDAEPEIFYVAGTGFTQAMVGEKMYASDDQTASTTQGANEQEIGRAIELVSATMMGIVKKSFTV